MNPSPLNLTFTTTLISNSLFNNTDYSELCEDLTDESWGAFIFDKTDNDLRIENTAFEGGCS